MKFFKKLVVVGLTLIGLNAFSANEVFTDKKPTDNFKNINEAIKAGKAGVIQQCRQIRINDNGKFAVYPGTVNTFHAAAPAGLIEPEKAEELLADRKNKVWRCTEVERSTEKMKFVTVK